MDPSNVQYPEPAAPEPVVPESLDAREALRHLVRLCLDGNAVVVRLTGDAQQIEYRCYRAPVWGREIHEAAFAEGVLGAPVPATAPEAVRDESAPTTYHNTYVEDPVTLEREPLGEVPDDDEAAAEAEVKII